VFGGFAYGCLAAPMLMVATVMWASTGVMRSARAMMIMAVCGYCTGLWVYCVV